MKGKKNPQLVNASQENEELNYEVEGYDSCDTTDTRCEQDSFGGGCMWTCDN